MKLPFFPWKNLLGNVHKLFQIIWAIKADPCSGAVAMGQQIADKKFLDYHHDSALQDYT